MSYPALTTAFAAPEACTMWNLEGCGILPAYTSDGTSQSACTGEVFPTQACHTPNSDCYPSADSNGDPVMTYAGSICPDGMEAAETSTAPNGVWCCPSGLTRWGDSYCTGTSSSGTFLVTRTDDSGACQTTSTVTFGPQTTGFFDYVYSTFDSSVTLPYPLDRMAMEITANAIYLVNDGGATTTPTPTPTDSSSSEPTTSSSTPTGTASGSYSTSSATPYPTSTPSSSVPSSTSSAAPSGSSESTYSSATLPTETLPSSSMSTSASSGAPSSSGNGGGYPTTPVPTGSSTPSPTTSAPSSSSSPPTGGANGHLDANASALGGLLMAALGYLMML